MRVEKLIGSKKVEIVPQSLYNLLLLSAGFVCPSCHVTLEREFVAFCDRCGQRLDWENYRSAKVIFPVHR